MRNYAQLFAICKKHGIDYKDKVAEFTEGKTDSLKALTDGEYREFMQRMQLLNPPTSKGSFTYKPGNDQRRRIISMAIEMRWNMISKEVMMQRIDAFCLTKTKYKKKLNDLALDELNKVVFIFQTEVKKSFLNDLNR